MNFQIFFELSQKNGIPVRIFFLICKIFRLGIFNQKLKSASDREFYSLYDALRQFTKLGFLVS
jgi:phosphatidylserine synthase